MKKGNFDEAEKTFALVLEKYPELNKNQDVTMLQTELTLRREGKARALPALEAAYKSAKTNDRKIELAIKIAQACRDLKLYDKAIGYLRGSPRAKELPDQLYRVDYLLVACMVDKKEYAKALELVDVMLVQKPYYSHASEMLVRKAEILDMMLRTDEAIAIYKQVTESATGGDAVGVAWYDLGFLYQTRKGDLQKAKDCFDKAVGTLKDPDMKDIATRRSKAIDTILSYNKGKLPADTSKNMQHSSPEFKIGELFWLELNQPDSAFRHYCATACDTHYRAAAPKALYAAAWIARYSLKDTVRADSLYKVLLAGFPSNVYAQKAQEAHGDKVTIFTRRDSARAVFEAAEKIFLDDNQPDSAAEAYQQVFKMFPETEYGPEALYASAWIYDNVLDKNRTAKGLYELLCDSFPKCPYCLDEAKPRLKVVADSLAAMRSRRRFLQAAPAQGASGAAAVAPAKSKADSAQFVVADKDTSAHAAVPQNGTSGIPPGSSRGMYRGMPPPMPAAGQPPAGAAQSGVVHLSPSVIQAAGVKSDSASRADTAAPVMPAVLPAAPPDTARHPVRAAPDSTSGSKLPAAGGK